METTNINNLNATGGVIINKQKNADTMNKYFCSVGKGLANKIVYALNPRVSGAFNVNPEKNASDLRPLRYDTLEVQLTKSKHLKALTAIISLAFS